MNDRNFPGARRWLPLICLSLLVGTATPGWAQLRRPDGPSLAPRIPGDRSLSTDLQLSGAPRTSDYIVAVVNQEPITHTEIGKRVQRVIESAPANARLPATDELRRQVLDALIDEKVQLSHARNLGMGVSEAELDTAIENIAAQNQMTMAELRERMRTDGLDFELYRASLSEQILIQRIREREVDIARCHGELPRESADRGDSNLWHLIRQRPLIVFALSVLLLQLANASMMPLIASAVTARSAQWATVLVAFCIVVPQAIVALLSPTV